MSAADRIQKFCEDFDKLVPSSSAAVVPSLLINFKKLTAEITKLRTWLQRHQDETVPDGSKVKLAQLLGAYYNTATAAVAGGGGGGAAEGEVEKKKYLSTVQELLGDYLSLPEGKLLQAKDKKKVLAYLHQLSGKDDGQGTVTEENGEEEDCWIVQDIHEEKHTLTLQAVWDESLWLEEVAVLQEEGEEGEGLWDRIVQRYQASSRKKEKEIEGWSR